MNYFNKYQIQDHLAIELARRYSEECKEPFFVAVGKYPDFDLVSESRKIKIELKCESSPSRTEKVALEYWNSDLNSPSGILITKATLWLHLIPNKGVLEAIEYRMDTLKRIVIECGECKSNGRNALIKLVPLTTFREFAHRIFYVESHFYDEIQTLGSKTGAPAVCLK